VAPQPATVHASAAAEMMDLVFMVMKLLVRIS